MYALPFWVVPLLLLSFRAGAVGNCMADPSWLSDMVKLAREGGAGVIVPSTLQKMSQAQVRHILDELEKQFCIVPPFLGPALMENAIAQMVDKRVALGEMGLYFKPMDVIALPAQNLKNKLPDFSSNDPEIIGTLVHESWHFFFAKKLSESARNQEKDEWVRNFGGSDGEPNYKLESFGEEATARYLDKMMMNYISCRNEFRKEKSDAGHACQTYKAEFNGSIFVFDSSGKGQFVDAIQGYFPGPPVQYSRDRIDRHEVEFARSAAGNVFPQPNLKDLKRTFSNPKCN